MIDCFKYCPSLQNLFSGVISPFRMCIQIKSTEINPKTMARRPLTLTTTTYQILRHNNNNNNTNSNSIYIYHNNNIIFKTTYQHQYYNIMKNSNIYYVIASLYLLRSANAFQYGSITSSLNPNCSRHRHSTSRPSLLSRGMKSSSSTDRFEQSLSSSASSPSSQSTSYIISADGRSRKTSLSVATLGDGVDGRTTTTTSWFDSLGDISTGSGNDVVDVDAATKVLSASLLVTSNTVGPSMFTLPEAVGGVGMMWGTVIFFGKLKL